MPSHGIDTALMTYSDDLDLRCTLVDVTIDRWPWSPLYRGAPTRLGSIMNVDGIELMARRSLPLRNEGLAT